MHEEAQLSYIEPDDGPRLAYRLRPGSLATLVFLPGYASDMEGTKAVALDSLAARRGLSMLRFDYSGTGSSEGSFEDGTLERWLEEALLMVDRLTEGPLIVVGSSMGGWIAMHVALRRPDRVQSVVEIAAAPDFTDWGYSSADKLKIVAEGRLEQPNPYGPEPQVTTRLFWESGEKLRLLDNPIDLDCPVRLLHGDRDEDVPLDVAMRLLGRLRSADVQLNIIKGGGHRLSQPNEIEAVVRTVAALVEPVP